MSKEVTVKDDTFEQEVLKSDIPVLVDFWAEWCAPCKMMAPVLEEIASKYDGKLKVAKLNVDENKVSAGRYRIQAIPYLAVFKGGDIVKELIGVQPKAELEKALNSVLS